MTELKKLNEQELAAIRGRRRAIDIVGYEIFIEADTESQSLFFEHSPSDVDALLAHIDAITAEYQRDREKFVADAYELGTATGQFIKEREDRIEALEKLLARTIQPLGIGTTNYNMNALIVEIEAALKNEQAG